MMLSPETLAHIALDLQRGISYPDRFQRLIQSLRQILRADAAALLRYENGVFIPLAIDGLSPDVLGRRFRVTDHPRLESIARAGNVVRFPADSELPDPYDGLLPQHHHLRVHACAGLPLLNDHSLVGALTIDGLNPRQFDHIDDQTLSLIGALVSAALTNALLLERLSRQQLETAGGRVSAGGDEDADMIGESPAMLQLKQEIAVVAGSDLNVLILGETGVGKELIARAVHRASPRRRQALIYLNCAALPDSVAESELFGHVKGAFTGAIHNRAGKFELADRGTLFLDEIGELSLPLQAKLLRVLQYGDIQRIGDDSQLRVDVRILAATNRDLKQEVLAGRFRADLYHRLSVFPLHAPALRERRDDIPLLAGYFAERCRVTMGLEGVALRPLALTLLSEQPWPGNVRELEHAVHRAAVLARAEQGASRVVIDVHHLRLTPARPEPAATPEPLPQGHQGIKAATDAFQRVLIQRTLDAKQGNWAATARQLEVDPANLHRQAQRLGMK
ncbi:nitric oxide reductase transcriptional regulator NorR [Brenneria populi subsp. brevivirga]|uniref:nitric oxide reductase transcriptional regulator NorR n=1 Tax=Brenneria populi TaxID=1505588 RepID=UPI002E172667|nr:nitric oxide reductase transcriptional regulator NorR [Brenneria populi subsp. brevivirga]